MNITSIGSFIRTVRHLSAHQVLARLDYRMRCFYYKSPLYPIFNVPEEIPEKLSFTPPHLWKGSKKTGEEIAQNNFTFIGRSIAFGNQIQWKPKGASALWVYNLHYFEWLKDLRASGDADHARALMEDWIKHNNHFDTQIWHPYPSSLRLISWITHADWLMKGASEGFKDNFMESLTLQADHLQKVLEWDVGGNHLIKNLKAVIFAGLTLPKREGEFLEALRLLLDQLSIQILKDGAHYELSPHYHVDVLTDLLDIHTLIRKAGQKPPSKLSDAIDRMAETLEFYRYPDGMLGLFNDADIHNKKDLSAIVKLCGGVENTPDKLGSAGYVKMQSKNTMLMVDVGKCCPDELPAHAHADTLSFEMCLGTERIFVNSGTYAYQDKRRNELRGTAAHNTVIIGKQNSAEVWKSFRLGRRPTIVKHKFKHDGKAGLKLSAEHNGYRHIGAKHVRKIFVSDDGKDVLGEDIIKSKKHHQVLAHFHLHPDVSYALKGDNEVEITTAKGKKLSFKVSGGRLHDAQSIYAPRFGEIHDSKQLIVRGKWGKNGCKIKWAIKTL